MDYKQMCIQQGYVPSTCIMEGQMCWLLVNSQGDPCKGCNANRSVCNGGHAPYENKEYGFMCFLDKIDEAEKKRQKENEERYRKIIEQRKAGHMDGFTRTILEVRWELLHKNDAFLEVIVKDIIDEKAYITKCKDIYEMLSIVMRCCSKYNVEQIHIEENGLGASIYDSLIDRIKGIDIVPLRYTRMQI